MNRKLHFGLFGILISSLSVSLFGQQNVSINGKTYKVFPYRMNEPDFYGALQKTDVPFYPGRLDDGEYAVLFNKPEYLSNEKLLAKYQITPAAIFNIVNGKKQGPAVFYTAKYKKGKKQGNVLAHGYYNHDERDGRWVQYNYSAYAKISDSVVFNFKNGLLNGPVLKTNHKGRVYESGNYKNGLEQGRWIYRGIEFADIKVRTYDSGKLDGEQIDTTYKYIAIWHCKKGVMGNIVEFNDRSIHYGQRAVLTITDTNFLLKNPSVNYADSADYAKDGNSSFDFFADPHDYSCRPDIMGIPYKTTTFSGENRYQCVIAELSKCRYTVELFDEKGIKTGEQAYFGDWHKISEFDYSLSFIESKIKFETNYRLVNKKAEIHPLLGQIYHQQFYKNGRLMRESYFTCKGGISPVYEKVFNENTNKKGNYYIYRTSLTPAYYFWKTGKLTNVFVVDSWCYKKYGPELKMGYISAGGNYYYFHAGADWSSHNCGGFWPWLAYQKNEPNQLIISSVYEIKDKKNSLSFSNEDTVKLMPEDSLLYHKVYLYKYSEEHPITGPIELGDAHYPVIHPLVLLNKVPFTGDLELEGSKHSQSEILLKKGVYQTPIIRLRFNNGYGIIKSLNTMHILEGYVVGEATFMIIKADGQWQEVASAEYSNGVMNGAYKTIEYDRFAFCQYKNGIQMGDAYEISNLTHTDYEFIQQYNYKYNLQEDNFDGPFMGRNSGGEYQFVFKNGIINGAYRNTYKGTILDSVNFVNDLPDGEYASYYMTERMTTRMPALKAKFSRGKLFGDVKQYFDNGQISCKVSIKDTLPCIVNRTAGNFHTYYQIYLNDRSEKSYYDNYIAKKLNLPENQMLTQIFELSKEGIRTNYGRTHLIEFTPNWPGYYTYYYKSGLKSQEGEVADGKRTGWWKFYSETGVLYKEIKYEAGKILNPIKHDSIRVYGFCKGYTNTGAKLYEGYIADQKFSYICATDANISFEELYYTRFYDSLGNNILDNTKYTHVTEYHLTGTKRFDGWWRNGVRDSTWYFYSAGATLNEVGKYTNGARNGRWISGDLNGINYLDNACFKEDELHKVQELLKSLEFTEEIYDHGKLLSRRFWDVNTDGESKSYGTSNDLYAYSKIPWHWGKRKIRKYAYQEDAKRKFKFRRVLKSIYKIIFYRKYKHRMHYIDF